jgi:hypothetical protein
MRCSLLLLLQHVQVALAEPAGLLPAAGDADVLVTSDQLSATAPAGDAGLELPTEVEGTLNLGGSVARTR